MDPAPDAFGVEEARKRLPELLERAAGGERLVIQRHHKPLAALVPLRENLFREPLTRQQAIQSLMSLQGSLKRMRQGTCVEQNTPKQTGLRFEPRQLSRGSRIGIDGSALLAFLSNQPGSTEVLQPILQGIAQGSWQGVISSLSLMAVLEKPIGRGDEALVQRYRAAFSNWMQVDVDPELVAAATRLKAQEPQLGNLQAIELATAIRSETAVLVTAHVDLAQTALHPVLSAARPS